jgi:hypothetical protein
LCKAILKILGFESSTERKTQASRGRGLGVIVCFGDGLKPVDVLAEPRLAVPNTAHKNAVLSTAKGL